MNLCEVCQTEEATKRLTYPNGIIASVCDSCFITEKNAQAEFYDVSNPNSNDAPLAVDASANDAIKPDKDIIVPLLSQKQCDEIIERGYEGFFNQTVIEIDKLTIEEIAQFINTEQEALFGLKAEEFRRKVRKHTAKIKYDEMLSKLSKEERDKLITNPDFVYTEKKKLASPLLKSIDKKKKAKSSLDDKLDALLGIRDDMSDEEKEKIRKLLS